MPSPPFAAWLATLSLDAHCTDLCPNLAYIPLRQLRRLYHEGCAPGAAAIAEFQLRKRGSRKHESRRTRIGREMAGAGHSDAARSSAARSDEQQEQDRRAVDQDQTKQQQKPGSRSPKPGGDESPEN